MFKNKGRMSDIGTSWRRTVATVGICAIAVLLPRNGQAQASGSRAGIDGVPIDHWLVSTSFPVDGGAGESPLTGPGVEGVLPDRGREQAGTLWTLIRRDGQSDLRLDSLYPERESAVYVYAHAYVRLPVDETVLLSWGGLGNTGVRAWVNGRAVRDREGEPIAAIADVTIPVRLGGGWNTVLFQAESIGNEFGLSATLSAPGSGTPIRIQASRPPGDIRTGPAPWVLVEPTARLTGGIAWSRDRLSGELLLELTAWSRAPIDTVDVRLRLDGEEARGGARWLTPGTPAPVSLWLPLEKIEQKRSPTDSVSVEVKWDDVEVKQRIGGPVELTADGSDITAVRLAGWEVKSVATGPKPDRIGPAGPLPDGAGWVMSGEWKVPDSMAGRSLYLLTGGAPGKYAYGKREFAESDLIPLCTGCRKGEKIEILARSSGAWDALPVVVDEPPTAIDP